VPTGSSYYLAIDTSAAATFKYNDISQSGSVVSRLLLPAFIRIGGTFDGTLQIKCEAKNDKSSPRNLSEIIGQYFTYLKHAEISRGSIPDTMRYTDDYRDITSEWLSKGIRIKSISESGLLMRPRGDNDKIFGVTVNIAYSTEYFEDFPLSTLSGIDFTINTFYENFIKTLTFNNA
jgi:hypothetical protein